MRRLSALLIALIILGCAATQQVTETKPDNNNQYTWDGKYDPTMFFKWKMTDARQTESGHIMVRFEDPNSDMVVGVLCYPIPPRYEQVAISAYHYFEDGIEYMFVLNTEKKYYTQVLPSRKNGI